MDVKSLYFYEVSKFMHSVYHGRNPHAFDDYFQNISHSHNTRHRHTQIYSLPQPRTERGKRSLKYIGVEIWAKIPDNLKTINNPKRFNYLLKEHIFLNLDSEE